MPSDFVARIPLLCVGAAAGYSIYCLVADQWISHRRRQIVKAKEVDVDEGVCVAASTQYASLIIGGRFVNPFAGWRDKSLMDFIWWIATRKGGNGLPSDREEIERNLPLAIPDFPLLREMSLPNYSNADKITATWLGQSTCFVQLEGLNILTDPIFKQRTVYSWLGPERLQPAPCQLEDLPLPDIVLVSHNHFDHLDIDVVNKLRNRVTWYVPMGLRTWFARQGVYKVREMDWWQEKEYRAKNGQSYKVVATPTQHWSGRNGFDSNCSLWASFLVKGSKSSVFHCGDTGYCPAFAEVGKQYGPISLAILPIGSYEPRWYMCHQHINPEDAVLIHKDLRARSSIGVHWGTFMMSDEHYMAPPKDLSIACSKYGLEESEFIAPQLGKTLVYGY